jgi:uncharacterized protein (UPF0332 family)
MPFDPKGFLTIAKGLISDVKYGNESAHRTCVSRAYESAFLVCRTFLEKKHGFNFPRSSDVHRLVVKRLRQRRVVRSLTGSPYWTRFTVADALKDLRENGRNKADYDMTIWMSQGAAQYWIQQAEYIVNRIP